MCGIDSSSALSGLGMIWDIEPRALPWAIPFGPAGAARGTAELTGQFAGSAKLEKAIKANLKGLGYGG